MFYKSNRVVCRLQDLFIHANKIASIRRSKFLFLVIFSELTVQCVMGSYI